MTRRTTTRATLPPSLRLPDLLQAILVMRYRPTVMGEHSLLLLDEGQHARAQQAVDNPSSEGDQYLEAVVKEAMRGLSEALHDDAADFRPERFFHTNPAPNTRIPCRGRPATLHRGVINAPSHGGRSRARSRASSDPSEEATQWQIPRPSTNCSCKHGATSTE